MQHSLKVDQSYDYIKVIAIITKLIIIWLALDVLGININELGNGL